jgi:hypothetical protein
MDGKPSSALVELQPRERSQFSFAGTRNDLGVHGSGAHLDGLGTGTCVKRPGENQDPNVRTKSKSSVTIKPYKIGHTKL